MTHRCCLRQHLTVCCEQPGLWACQGVQACCVLTSKPGRCLGHGFCWEWGGAEQHVGPEI
jgi:hypothetical protein